MLKFNYKPELYTQYDEYFNKVNSKDLNIKIQTDEKEITMDILLSDIKRNLIFRDTEEEVKDLLLTAPNLIFYKSLVDAFNISSVKMGQLYRLYLLYSL